MRAVVTFILCLWALGAAADPLPGDVARRFDAWLAAQGRPAAVLVVLREGREFLRVERGLGAAQPVDLQSNSKAITAHCLRALVDAGAVRWETPLSQILATESVVTLADLVTHTSGLWPDETQGRMARWRDGPAPRWPEVTARALGRPVQGDRGTYAYNNENYAVLGVVIETVTRQPYDVACAQRVLAPLGVTGRLSPQVGALGPWGGWQMSALDYARFHRAMFAGRDPKAHPLVSLGGGAAYGLGMISRPDGAGHNFWHFGSLCFGDGRGNGGSYAVSWGTRWTVVAEYHACVDHSAMVALDRTMVEGILLAR